MNAFAMDILRVALIFFIPVFLTKLVFENHEKLPPFRIFRLHVSAILLGYLAFIEDYTWFIEGHFSLNTLTLVVVLIGLVWVLPFKWLKKEMAYDGEAWSREALTSEGSPPYDDAGRGLKYAGMAALPRPSPYQLMGINAVQMFGKAIFIGVVLGIVVRLLLTEPA